MEERNFSAKVLKKKIVIKKYCFQMAKVTNGSAWSGF